MSIFYDLHMHSCLSPCGDNDMTPFNLVNMAALKGLDIIALTDHNTCKNCGSAVEAGREAGIKVVPGMELCTSEDIHVVCLFPAVDNAMAFDDYVYRRIPRIKNQPEIFGDQIIMDKEDNVVGKEELLLVTASEISIDNVESLVKSFDGISFPAHIDKNAYSVLSSFGMFPEEIGFSTVEVTSRADREELKKEHPALRTKRFISNSDAHYLWDINEKINSIESDELFRIL